MVGSIGGLSSAEKGRHCYQVLGLPHCSPIEAVKKRFKELALQQHPDKNLDDPQAVERFQALNMAYELLSNVERKKSIDDALVFDRATLAPAEDLQSAAALFRKHHSSQLHEELSAFRMQRRAQSQNGRVSSAHAANPERPSQYTKEQTEFFRQREKEREREMAKRIERDREQQRQQELERYRLAQEERLKEEERRSREARAKLERVEASLAAAASARANNFNGSPLQQTTSFRGLRRSDPPSHSRSGSCDAAVGSPALSTPRRLAGVGSTFTPLQTPRPVLGNVLASPTDLFAASPELTDDATERPGQRQRREKERQDEVRRQEQERYLERRMQDVRAREELRAKEAAEEEQRIYDKELNLLIENENAERKQFLEQEEELERRLLWSTWRRVENSSLQQRRKETIYVNEDVTRSQIHREEEVHRRQLAFLWILQCKTSLLHEAEASERYSLFRMHSTARLHRESFEALRMDTLSTEKQVRSHIESQCSNVLERAAICHLYEPIVRHTLNESLLTSHRFMVEWYSLFAALLQNEARQRECIERDEKLTREAEKLFVMQKARRQVVVDMEIEAFVFLQRRKGAHLHQIISQRSHHFSTELDVLRLRHDAEVSRLIEEIAQLHEQLDAKQKLIDMHAQNSLSRGQTAVVGTLKTANKIASAPTTDVDDAVFSAAPSPLSSSTAAAAVNESEAQQEGDGNNTRLTVSPPHPSSILFSSSPMAAPPSFVNVNTIGDIGLSQHHWGSEGGVHPQERAHPVVVAPSSFRFVGAPLDGCASNASGRSPVFGATSAEAQQQQGGLSPVASSSTASYATTPLVSTPLLRTRTWGGSSSQKSVVRPLADTLLHRRQTVNLPLDTPTQPR